MYMNQRKDVNFTFHTLISVLQASKTTLPQLKFTYVLNGGMFL